MLVRRMRCHTRLQEQAPGGHRFELVGGTIVVDAQIAERRAKAAAKDELADIQQEEAKLRERRHALQKQFHLRSV